ncbi:nuclear valosin-containing protein-like isoform X1 [Hemicordylus capensis]|uniref:nuclear valosin-containing protein-like isoform X1 n=1 Tax=Hemicordylus capensis TaxID=884348 RepID=UPI002302A0B3|nr:nuclear valosin-containing protein-like isoform X1 [Hemicordylus capensis]XP_053164102.1 nuclear valosin-containing protein-like isoform X1 [Hemicordylus capensis]XP_053164112.1 nuclear valosin-containing protein-like isoform X1 [Hemicordylus capensis]
MRSRGGGYPVGDLRLKQRVKQYLSSNKCGQYVDIGILAADLQKTYSADYGRRKRNAFRIQVEKVFGIISSELKSEDLAAVEDEHLAKKARCKGEEDDSESCMDTSDTDIELSTSNHMNSSLLTLYRKGNPDSLPAAPKNVLSKSSTPAQMFPGSNTPPHQAPSDTRISEGGWFIDKTPSTKEDNFLIDLCAEESDSGKQIAENSKDLPFLEATRKKSKNKQYKRRKVESQDVDEEIESALRKQKVKQKGIELRTSSVTFEDVGGNDETLKEVCKMLIHIRHPEVYNYLGAVAPRGFLLHGPPGCGKTLLAQAVAGVRLLELELPMLKVAATEMVSGVSGESEQKLRELFDQAVANAPCILFIDEIDAITPKREVASKDMERRIVAQLLTCMDDLNDLAAAAQVLVIGATNRPDALDPALRRAGRFDREICLGIPDEAAREKILKTLCRKLRLPESFDFVHLAHMTPGYVGADLMALCREAAMCTVNRVLVKLEEEKREALKIEDGASGQGVERNREEPVNSDINQPELPTKGELQRLLELLKEPNPLGEDQLQKLCIEMNDFIIALSSVQPSAKREGFVTVPDVTWADIGALEDIREELIMAILAPVQNPEQFRALGLTAPAGILLAGPPGCGKTLLAKAVANESGLNFISVKGPELLNMYVGESERAVRQVFQRARNSAPCVIFFDEVDALCPRRSDRESGASVRVVNQLLTEMDGLESRRQVFIMAATNRPDIIDPAILRPGRLDKTLYVGLPPPWDRLDILKTITKDGTRPPLEVDVDLEEIAHDPRCNCYTGADLSALVREASVCALRQEMRTPNGKEAAAGGVSISQPRRWWQKNKEKGMVRIGGLAEGRKQEKVEKEMGRRHQNCQKTL